jgi:hypothetical protein
MLLVDIGHYWMPVLGTFLITLLLFHDDDTAEGLFEVFLNALKQRMKI